MEQKSTFTFKDSKEFAVKNSDSTHNTFTNIPKLFDVDWDKIETVEDIKILLKGLQMHVFVCSETIPDHMKELFEKDFLVERK